MKIKEIIEILQNKITNLNSEKSTLISLGDLAKIELLEVEISETEATLQSLKSI